MARIKGKKYEKDTAAREPWMSGRAPRGLPECLREFHARELLDTEFEREPLPDEITIPLHHNAWESAPPPPAGNRRVPPLPDLDQRDRNSLLAEKIATHADQEDEP